MNILVKLTLVAVTINLVSLLPHVNAQTDAPVVTLTAEDAIYQGRVQSSDSRSSESWLGWQLNLQDGTIIGTTQRIRASFEEFPAYDPTSPFSFAPQEQQLRTLLDAEIIGYTDFSQIGSKYCFDSPRWNYRQEVAVNGITYIIPKQLFGTESFDSSTQVIKSWGIKFTPELVERLLKDKGVFLKNGDNVIWKVIAENRFTVWDGKVISSTQGCLVTGASAFDATATGMTVQMHFVWFNPLEQILKPTTSMPDLDGDGIPDSVDACDFTPERYNNFQDTDGCPDQDPVGFIPTVNDIDGDGIIDSDDMCPTQPEIFNTIEDGDGCPDGAIIPSQAGVVSSEPIPTTEQDQSFSQTQTSPTDPNAIQTTEENPQTDFQVVSEPTGSGGNTSLCDNSSQNCNQFISSQIQQAQLTTGFKLPFPPTVLNLVILFGSISAIVLVLLRATKKI